MVVRDATRVDADEIAELLNAHSLALFDESDLVAATVEGWFELPRVVWFALAERDGRVVGYADLQRSEAHADIDARALEPAAAHALVQGCVERAGTDAPIRGYAPATDEAASSAYRNAGFRIVRHSFTMEIGLVGPTDAPVWPDGVTVRPWREGDDPAFHAALEEAFADHFGFEPRSFGEWRHGLDVRPETDRSLWYLALAGEEVAGVAICSWHSSGDRTFGWVGELGVRAPWRRRGLGFALLRHAFGELGRRGATRVGLGVDAENTTGAVRLYERAGMHVTRRYDTWELGR